MEKHINGRVVKIVGKNAYVLLLDNEKTTTIEARINKKTKLLHTDIKNPIVVGDKVELMYMGEMLVVNKILERENYIQRKSINYSKKAQTLASNIDQLLLFFTYKNPTTYLEFIDRYICGATMFYVPVVLVINKVDLIKSKEEKEDIKYIVSLYEKLGFEVLQISSLNDDLEKLKPIFKGKINMIGGNSGAGKSTFIQKLCPNKNIGVGELSVQNLGKHTTTFSEMIQVDKDSFLVDSPGIKGFGLEDIIEDINKVKEGFKEIYEIGEKCKFSDCIHSQEPNCEVIKAVECGEIEFSRYKSYLNIIDEISQEKKYRRD